MRYLNPKKFETFSIYKLPNDDWRRPIIEILKNPTRTIDGKITYKALSYVIIRNELFQNNPEDILLKFLVKVNLIWKYSVLIVDHVAPIKQATK